MLKRGALTRSVRPAKTDPLPAMKAHGAGATHLYGEISPGRAIIGRAEPALRAKRQFTGFGTNCRSSW